MFEIAGRTIGINSPTYVIAEMSANHGHRFETAVQVLQAAKEAGADAIKLQTYTADTITMKDDSEYFQIRSGSMWDGRTLYDLYSEAYMPWEWQPKLKQIADELDIHLFSSPFDKTAVNFLEEMDVPAYKIASFEIVDIPLIRHVARAGKPIIMSTGMATLAEIDEAVQAIRGEGNDQIALLKCTSAYPAPAEEMNLQTIPHLSEAFSVPVGLSDHTLGIAVPVTAVALGAAIVEKHLTLSRDVPGPDSAFSLEPHELREMIAAIRTAEKAIGTVQYEATEKERANRIFRRSLFVVQDISAGETFTRENVRSIRPGHGLHPRFSSIVLGKQAAHNINSGTPLTWDLILE